MMSNYTLNIGKDFSIDPAGRHYTDGPASGEDFRENYLLVRLGKLTQEQKLDIVIDGEIEAYGSSFLSEAFAGIVKYGYMDKETLLAKINIVFTNQEFNFYKQRILKYIDEAQYRSRAYTPSK